MKEIFLDSPYLCFFFAIFVVAALRDVIKAFARKKIVLDLPPLKKPEVTQTGEDPKAKN